MKNPGKKLIIVLVLLFIVYLAFQDRISGTCQMYQLVTKATNVISKGGDHYTLKIGAGIVEGKEKDTVTAIFSRRGNSHFTANVSYNESRYVILQRGDSTKVIIGNPGLLIEGKSDTAGHFDVAGLPRHTIYPGHVLVEKSRAGCLGIPKRPF